ncbi:MAG TPA: hypothetical protein VLF89_04855 [Candidatus Saccharimonadales bacterium]|nr:hypothetical protein [Candidatus Saccharimonadales bacterium]HSW97127.1 hypothetical protein [Candidatus Saccharimonadales bacterium]
MAKAKSKNSLDQLETKLDEWFGKKAPQLPKNIRQILVNIAPYLEILSVIITVPSLFVLLGLGGAATVVAPMGGAQSVSTLPTMWIGIFLLIPVVILQLLAIPGLFGRKVLGWKYIYWAQIVSLVSNVVELNIIGAIIGALIGFYILFQIKSYYK